MPRASSSRTAIGALSDRDRALLEERPDLALTPSERNRLHVGLHRVRRRLRRRLRGWLIGVYVGRHAGRRDEIAESILRTGFAAAAMAVVGSSMFQGTPLPAAAAPDGPVEIENKVIERVLPTSAEPTAVARDGSITLSTSRHRRTLGESTALSVAESVLPESRRPLLTLNAPLGNQAAAGTGKRPPRNESIVCARGLRVVPDTCVEHPLRKDPEPIVPYPKS
jgi:hypothetical protein